MVDTVATQLHDIASSTLGLTIEAAAIVPPGFEGDGKALPLLIHIHGGGGDRETLIGLAPLYQAMFADGTLPPMVMVSFSAGHTSFYHGALEDFVTDELPAWAAETFGTRMDRDGTLLTGISMGGYGTLKIGLKNPKRFCAIAALEPAIEPSYDKLPANTRSSFMWMPGMAEAIWGEPLIEAEYRNDNPAAIARSNADAIRASGIEIYLEVGDQDHIHLHDGAEFMHRVLWDHDIRHEYHLVRWADHVGLSMGRRLRESHRFLANALAGGRAEPVDLPLTDDERRWVDWSTNGEMIANTAAPVENAMRDPARAPSVHAAIWEEPRARATANDPEGMQRAYGELPPTR